jgi:hypothetical protein
VMMYWSDLTVINTLGTAISILERARSALTCLARRPIFTQTTDERNVDIGH